MTETYAGWFRASTPYIRAHRGRIFVVMLGADALASENAINIVHDLALLHVLGVRLVVVHGAEVEADGPVTPGLLADIQAAVAEARAELESLFTTGIPLSPLRDRHIPLATGNLVTARPIGVLDGGCCALFPLDADAAELACLVGGGAVGPRLLEAAEQAAASAGMHRLFALTTQAVDWFLEHGFAKTAVDALPVDRKALYNYGRNSHVLVKELHR